MRKSVICPECGRMAEVIERFNLGSTDGPIEHLRIACPAREPCRVLGAGGPRRRQLAID